MSSTPSSSAPPTVVQGAGTLGVQVDQAALAPLVAETPPLEPRTWLVRVVATDTGLDPDEIVVEPGQKVAITYDTRNGDGAPLTFRLPDGPVHFATRTAGARLQTFTITAPDRAGRYAYVIGDGSAGRQGWLIVNPTAAGSSAPFMGARDIRIVAHDFSFNPTSPMVRPGERVRVTFFNDGAVPHNLAFALPGSQVTFANPLAPGEMRTVTLTVPRTGGRFDFYDPVGGNRDRGMQGTVMIYQPGQRPGIRPGAQPGVIR